jgi:hypothetical protein
LVKARVPFEKALLFKGEYWVNPAE